VEDERLYLRIEKTGPAGPPIKLCWDCAGAPSNLATPPFIAGLGPGKEVLEPSPEESLQPSSWGAIKSTYRAGDGGE
jgi:hypothetical protein